MTPPSNQSENQLAAIAVVSLLGALGATGNELFMYPYWILEKGYGKHVGSPDDPGSVLISGLIVDAMSRLERIRLGAIRSGPKE